MRALVGYTGFVGGNLYAHGLYDAVYNSKNIAEAYGTSPDLLVYAGVRAEKFLANSFPIEDFKIMEEAFLNIKKIQPKKLVLISTVDVYKNPIGVDEDTVICEDELEPYGLNRYKLENMVREEWEDALIIRLPALYGEGLKKNFLYDLIHMIPSMLKKDKYMELSEKEKEVKEAYEDMHNGFYRLKEMDRKKQIQLKKIFEEINFTALNFTDSRSKFQFYPLSRLENDIKIALTQKLKCLNITTAPLNVAKIYNMVKNKEWVNEFLAEPKKYNFLSKHAKLFGGSNGYFMSEEESLKSILTFVKEREIK